MTYLSTENGFEKAYKANDPSTIAKADSRIAKRIVGLKVLQTGLTLGGYLSVGLDAGKNKNGEQMFYYLNVDLKSEGIQNVFNK